MRFVVSFIVCLVLSCIFNSIGAALGVCPAYLPVEWPSGIGQMKGTTTGSVKTGDNSLVGEININEKSRPVIFTTEIEDKNNPQPAEFPFGGNM